MNGMSMIAGQRGRRPSNPADPSSLGSGLAEKPAQPTDYNPPTPLQEALMKVRLDGFSWVSEAEPTPQALVRAFSHSFIHACDDGDWSDEVCAPIADLVSLLRNALASATARAVATAVTTPPSGLSHPPLEPVDVSPEDSALTWLSTWKPLQMYQHGNLSGDNVLVDVRGQLWLIDFASAGVANSSTAFADAAKLVSCLLLEHFPCPISIDEVKSASLPRLMDLLDASSAVCARFKKLVNAAESVSDLFLAAQGDDALKPLLARLAPASKANERMQEACGIIDELFGADANGSFPELWQLAKRDPPTGWPSQASLTFRLCTRVIELSCELGLKCSQREQAAATGREDSSCVSADLHAANFLMPLLSHALCYLRLPTLGKYQQRVAWHIAVKLATILATNGVLARAPTVPVGVVAPAVQKELRLAAGLRIATLIEPESRMGGGEGVTKLSRILPDGEDAEAPQMAENVFGVSKLETRVTFDTVSQIVLPWNEPKAGAVEAVLEEAKVSYGVLKEIVDLTKRVPELERSTVDEPDRKVETKADDMDVAADRIKIELKRLQGASEPLTESVLNAVVRVEQAKSVASKARETASEAQEEAKAAEKEAASRKEAATDSAEIAAMAAETTASATEKAAVARAEKETAEGKAKDLQNAAQKALEASAKLGGSGNTKGKPTNSLAEQMQKDVEAAAEKAIAAYAAAEAQMELATSRMQALQRAASNSEEESQAAKEAAERSAAKAADLANKASVSNFRDGLLSAVAVDRTALERSIEAWALGKLRKTGAAGQRAYAAGQRLVVFDPNVAKGDPWVDMQVSSPPQQLSNAENVAEEAAPQPDRVAAAAAAVEADESFNSKSAGGNTAGGSASSSSFVQKRTSPWGKSAAKRQGTMSDLGSVAKAASVASVVAAASMSSKGGKSAGSESVDAPVDGANKPINLGFKPGSKEHILQTSAGKRLEVLLHPWNHGPADMACEKFDSLRKRHARSMKGQHATLVDALTGRRLDVIDQCVPVEIAPIEGRPPLTYAASAHKQVEVTDVESLAAWLMTKHAARCRDGVASTHLCILLTAGPASGKTCLMSQLVTHVLKDDVKGHLVPVLLRVQKLQRMLSMPKKSSAFSKSWNWVDAYLQAEYGATSDQYAMLRQAMASRRALLLIDGIDEGGKARESIERHVTEVLAVQGHPMLVTSRPAGLNEEAFAGSFHRLRLLPLTDQQQLQVTEQRAGSNCEALTRYVAEKVPLDMETGARVTGNPLMLSVVISLFESRQAQAQAGQLSGGTPGDSLHGGQGVAVAAASKAVLAEMPETTVALYDMASNAVLEREGLLVMTASHDDASKSRGEKHARSVVPHLTALLQATFFEAHAAQRRVIEESQLEEAALGLVDPEKLTSLRCELPRYDGRAEAGHYVEVLAGPNMGRRGVVSRRPFRVTFDDGTSSEPLREADFRSSGLDGEEGRTFEESQRQRRCGAVKAACENLPPKVREALNTVMDRVMADKLPLLALLQVEPLQVQSSHLSFQEYYAAKGISEGRPLPSAAASPWRWEAWWHNTLKLGSEMGEAFGCGLVKATGEDPSHIELNGKLGGDRPTGLLAIAQLMRGCFSINLTNNCLTCAEAMQVSEGLRLSTRLQQLTLSNNRICGVWFDSGAFKGEYTAEGLLAVAHAVRTSPSLTKLDLSQNSLGVAYVDGVRVNSMQGITALTEAVGASKSLQRLAIGYNSLGPTAGKAVGDAFAASSSLAELDIGGNLIGLKGGKAICDAALSNRNMTIADMRFNSFDSKTKEQLKATESARSGIKIEL